MYGSSRQAGPVDPELYDFGATMFPEQPSHLLAPGHQQPQQHALAHPLPHQQPHQQQYAPLHQQQHQHAHPQLNNDVMAAPAPGPAYSHMVPPHHGGVASPQQQQQQQQMALGMPMGGMPVPPASSHHQHQQHPHQFMMEQQQQHHHNHHHQQELEERFGPLPSPMGGHSASFASSHSPVEQYHNNSKQQEQHPSATSSMSGPAASDFANRFKFGIVGPGGKSPTGGAESKAPPAPRAKVRKHNARSMAKVSSSSSSSPPVAASSSTERLSGPDASYKKEPAALVSEHAKMKKNNKKKKSAQPMEQEQKVKQRAIPDTKAAPSSGKKSSSAASCSSAGASITTCNSQQQQQQQQRRKRGSDGATQKSTYTAWKEAEDKRLHVVVNRAKESDTFRGDAEAMNKSKFWAHVASLVPKRSSKQCRERWRNSLDPSITHAEWTVREDLRLLQLHDEVGNKWANIATRIPGRTENGVKTRFKSIQRARKRQWTSQEDALVLQLYRQHGPRWNVIQSALPKRSLHGVKTRYRALISGSTSKPIDPGSPEQCLQYDHRTVNLEDLADSARPGPPTKKRVLIETMLNDEDERFRAEREKNKRVKLAQGPCIIPGFAAIPSASRVKPSPAAPAVLGHAKLSKRRGSLLRARRLSVVASANDRLRSTPALITSSVSAKPVLGPVICSPKATVKKERGLSSSATSSCSSGASTQVLAGKPGQGSKLSVPFHFDESVMCADDADFANTISDMLLNAKMHPDVDAEQYDGFQQELASLLMDNTACPPEAFSC